MANLNYGRYSATYLAKLRDESQSSLVAAAFALALSACEKSPGGETAPLPFAPDSQTSITQKTAELNRFIRAEMKRDDIPGVSIALVRDGNGGME